MIKAEWTNADALDLQPTCNRLATDCISRPGAIDAVDAIGHIATMPDGDKCIRRSAVKYTLSMLPSAQPEITRCRDCKYRDEKWRRTSVRWLPCMDVRTGDNWYCGSAERDEQDG